MSHVDDGTLHAYLDGELLPVERARLEAHVAECPACRNRLEEERALIERAGGLLGLAQPPERSAPPLHQLRRPRLAWRLRVPLAWAATVLLALGIGYYAGDLREARPGDSAALTSAVADSAAALARQENGTLGFVTRERRQVAARPPQSPPRAADAQKQAAPEAQLGIDGNAARSLRESTAAASRVIAIQPQDLRPRSAAPQAQPPASVAVGEVVVTTAERAAWAAADRGRSVATQWPIIRRGPARDILGAEPVGIPGLAVRNIRRSPTGEVVLVEQAIDSTTVIQLFQQRVEDDQLVRRDFFLHDSARARQPAAGVQLRSLTAGAERLARFIGGVRVEIAGPLSADSLNRLLEQLKPIGP